MCTELSERVFEATELVFEHRDAALHNANHYYKTKLKVEEYLWDVLLNIGIDDTEFGMQLINDNLVTEIHFRDRAKSLKTVWKQMVWTIIRTGAIKR